VGKQQAGYTNRGNGLERRAITQLNAIFRAIANNMSAPRIIPNGT
jgi:hypothetical protein